MELLFESRTNIGGMSGDLHFFQRAPTIHPEPVLKADTDSDGKGVSIYGSVLRDGGKLRMWYYAVPRTMSGLKDANYVGYAESDDGVVWKRPALGVVDHGIPNNNLTNFGLHSATVFIDPNGAPSHRYRGTGCGNPQYSDKSHEIERRGYYTVHSADGLRWELDSRTPQWPSSDVITSAYHPGRGVGIVALKYTPRLMRIARRCIHTAEFRDGEYSDDVSALYPDEFDDACAQTRGFHTCDYYGMGMLPAGQAIVGFLWKYWHALPYSKGFGSGQQALYGSSDVALVYQNRPGDRWLHVPGRPVFIDRTALPWTSGWINTASNVVEVGDEQRIYYSGRFQPHGFGLDEQWKPLPSGERTLEYSGITFASWPKWRLFGFEAMLDSTLKISLGKTERPSEMFLNYEITRPGGFIRAELTGEGIDERSPNDSVELTGHALAAKITWKTGSVIPAAPAARVGLHMRFARVYAYEVRTLKA